MVLLWIAAFHGDVMDRSSLLRKVAEDEDEDSLLELAQRGSARLHV